MSSLNKAAAMVVGSAVLAVGALVLAWSLFGSMAKAYLPHELGYSHLGWVRAGN